MKESKIKLAFFTIPEWEKEQKEEYIQMFQDCGLKSMPQCLYYI